MPSLRLCFAGAMLALVPCAALLAQQTPPKLHLVEELRIDGAAQEFSSMGAVVIGPDGRIVIAEPQDFRVRFYDAAGKEIAKFGRRGQGPGDFDMVGRAVPVSANIWLGVLGDTIWALDRGLKRFTLISKDGRLIRTVPLPDKLPTMSANVDAEQSPQRKLLGFDPRVILGDGSELGRVTWGRIAFVQAATGQQVRVTRDTEYGYAIASVRGDITRVVAQVPVSNEFVTVVGNGGLSSIGMAVPYLERVYESLAPDGSRFAFATTTIASQSQGILRIVVISAKGDTLLARDHRFVPVPVSKGTADSAIASRMKPYRPSADAKSAPSISPSDANELESRLRAGIPPAASVYRNLMIGSDYSLWLTGPRGPEGRQYTVLDDKGNPYGIVTFANKGAFVATATRTVVWVLEYDADDVASLVRYRIVR